MIQVTGITKKQETIEIKALDALLAVRKDWFRHLFPKEIDAGGELRMEADDRGDWSNWMLKTHPNVGIFSPDINIGRVADGDVKIYMAYERIIQEHQQRLL